MTVRSLDEAIGIMIENANIETLISAKDSTHLSWRKENGKADGLILNAGWVIQKEIREWSYLLECYNSRWSVVWCQKWCYQKSW